MPIFSHVIFAAYSDLDNRVKATELFSTPNGGYACFAPLKVNYELMANKGGVHYSCHKVIDEHIMHWYHTELNRIGLKSKLKVGKKFYNFYIKYQGKNRYAKMVGILCALRYLEENHFPKM